MSVAAWKHKREHSRSLALVLVVLLGVGLCAGLLTGCGASREPNGLDTKVTDLNAQVANLTRDKQKAEADLKAAQDALQKAQANNAQPARTMAPVSTSVPAQASGTVLFFDNFDNGLSSSWSLASGNWEAQAGDLHLRDAGNGYAYVLGGSGWKNYSVEADVKLGPGNRWSELVVRARDDLNKVSLAADTESLVFLTYIDGQKTNVESTRVRPGAPAECHVLVTAVGDQFNCYINGTLRAHYESSDFPAGTAGVGSIQAGGRVDTTHRFDNFKVTAMP
jgi:outer membrane murein-binding lipoprotein Lpp